MFHFVDVQSQASLLPCNKNYGWLTRKEFSPVESGRSNAIDTSRNTTPSAENDGTVIQSPGDSESPTGMQSPGGYDSGSTTEVDSDNELSVTKQESQYEYIGPLFVRLRVTMGSALFAKLVEQATDATMLALTRDALVNRRHKSFLGCKMFEYLYNEKIGKVTTAKVTDPGERYGSAYGQLRRTRNRLRSQAQFEIKKCARDALKGNSGAS